MYNRAISYLPQKYSKIVVNMKLLSSNNAELGQCILFLQFDIWCPCSIMRLLSLALTFSLSCLSISHSLSLYLLIKENISQFLRSTFGRGLLPFRNNQIFSLLFKSSVASFHSCFHNHMCFLIPYYHWVIRSRMKCAIQSLNTLEVNKKWLYCTSAPLLLRFWV